ncbi:MAG TPA: DinB family protein [Puia sp.]|nr:DinB family protein [Puia sp.]
MPLSTSASSRLQHQHTTIRELIAGLSEHDLKRVVQPDKWSAFDNIAHLASYQPMFLTRLERIQAEESPTFERYVADGDPLFSDYRDLPLAELLSGIDARRAVILSKLQGMGEDGLRRVAYHKRYGMLDVRQWTEFFLLHEAHHLYTIFMLVQELRKGLR